MMLFQSMKITQRSKKVWKYGPWTGVNIFWEGRAEKEGEGVTSDMLFPSSGISLKSQYMGQFLEGWTTNPSRVKWIYVQHLSVRPPCWMQCQEQLPHGNICSVPASGVRENGFPASSPAWNLLFQTILYILTCTLRCTSEDVREEKHLCEGGTMVKRKGEIGEINRGFKNYILF